jgi:hypothetical protein
MPPGHTEQATPPWLPMSTVEEPWTMTPLATPSPILEAGLPLMGQFFIPILWG